MNSRLTFSLFSAKDAHFCNQPAATGQKGEIMLDSFRVLGYVFS